MNARYVTAEVVVGPEDDETTLEAVLLNVLRTRAAAMPTAMSLELPWAREEDEHLPDGRYLARAKCAVAPFQAVPPPRKKGARR